MTTINKPLPATESSVRQMAMMGTRFLEPKMVTGVLGIKTPTASVQPFTEEVLGGAFARGEQLIWHPSRDSDGTPITMRLIHDRLENKAPLKGKILYSVDWYANEPFYTTDTVRVKSGEVGTWRLVGTTAVPGTKGVNFLEQTVVAARYVHDVIYGGKPPAHLKSILSEPKEREEEISSLIRSDWKMASEILSLLKFNQMFRDTPVEAMIRIVVNQEVNNVRLLENEWSWTSSRSSDGDLVSLGDADSDGSDVNRWSPERSHGNLGFFLSRSVTE